MHIFSRNKKIGILDSYLLQNSLRVHVLSIANLQEINDQYFVREKSFRKIYYYCKEIGIKNTLLKVLSRSREKIRNKKYFSMGIGKIIQSTSALFQPEQTIYFIATNHPACPERIVIHEKLAFLANAIDYSWLSEKNIVWLEKLNSEKKFSELLAWSPYSGIPISDSTITSILGDIKQFWKSISLEKSNIIPLYKKTSVSETKSPKNKLATKTAKNAVLFGYGNYAKTIILPNLHKKIIVSTIHEIDPTQLLPMRKNIIYDSSPYLRQNLKHDVYFVAGYHHTHVDIAIAGLQSGADVVVEKPLITSQKELEKLISVMRQSSSRLYACFQRRYHQFNDYVYHDFKLKRGDPISYYAIIYEESLPQLHWYHWPNSRSAIISNGCHWVDHFLFLNNFSAVLTSSVQKTKNGEIIIVVELINGATLSLTLSHTGSARIGMQEYVELRSGENTAKISNGNNYHAENSSRIIRRSKINKYESYKKMYHLISKNIIEKNGPPLNDSWEQVERVSSLILSLYKEV